MLVANALPFFRRFDTAPLIRPVLFKSGIYFAVVCVVRFLEKLIEFLVHGGACGNCPITWRRTSPGTNFCNPALDPGVVFDLHIYQRT